MQASDALTSKRELAVCLLRSTVLSSIRQPVTTARSGLAVAWNRPRALVVGNVPLPTNLESLPKFAPGSPEFEAALNELKCPPSSGTIK